MTMNEDERSKQAVERVCALFNRLDGFVSMYDIASAVEAVKASPPVRERLRRLVNLR